VTDRGDAYFLDANVVMYTVGAEHPLRDPCRRALRRAVDLRVPLITDAEVLQEILYRYYAIGRRETARSVYRHAVDLCDEVLPITGRGTARALELLDAHDRLTPRDAIHVATMEAAGLRCLLSTDRDFDGLAAIERIDPAAFASGV
jgi:hypothetical protein